MLHMHLIEKENGTISVIIKSMKNKQLDIKKKKNPGVLR